MDDQLRRRIDSLRSRVQPVTVDLTGLAHPAQSNLALRLKRDRDGVVIEGDDFYRDMPDDERKLGRAIR